MVQAPANVTQTITRGIYGKPLSVTQSGPYGGTQVSLTKTWLYDIYQRLCRTWEPESTGTVIAYDRVLPALVQVCRWEHAFRDHAVSRKGIARGRAPTKVAAAKCSGEDLAGLRFGWALQDWQGDRLFLALRCAVAP